MIFGIKSYFLLQQHAPLKHVLSTSPKNQRHPTAVSKKVKEQRAIMAHQEEGARIALQHTLGEDADISGICCLVCTIVVMKQIYSYVKYYM